MTPATRTVRRLRLSAQDAADVRRVLPTIEDAMRCASLGDDGARLIVVRWLALGRIASGMSSQALSRHIEQRLAHSGVVIVPADDGSAPADASAVSFASALQARIAWAQRAVRGQPCDAWYWALALPELAQAGSTHDALARVAATIAAWPEARAAWPLWCAAVVSAGGATRLATALSKAQGEALAARAGVLRPAAREVDGGEGGASGAGVAPGRVPASHAALNLASPALLPRGQGTANALPLPPWLIDTLVAAPAMSRAMRSPVADLASRQGGPSRAASIASMQSEDDAQHRDNNAVAPNRDRDTVCPFTPPRHASDTPHPRSSPDTAQRPLRSTRPPPETAHPYRDPTACGGLLFLLPVLVRLGLPQWLAAAASAHHLDFVPRVLGQALHRLRAPADDIAWSLATSRGPARALPVTAPPRWHDPLLRAPCATAHAPTLPDVLAGAADLDAQAAVWLTATRRWLRRAGGLGLASLVQRPAQLACTPTHVDVHFALSATDLRVRRCGLDLDPGWLPWYGRVVGFHYGERTP